jgi:hypothetical protein
VTQLKITSSSGQFITLYNASATTLDMGKYQLEYFNNYDLTKATSSRLISLSGSLAPHGYYVVSDDAVFLCYQLTIDSVSLGLSSTAGLVEVLAFNQTSPGGSVVPVLQDYVGWSKTSTGGAQTLPSNAAAFLQRQPVDAQNRPVVSAPGSGSWQAVQPDPNNACGLVSAANPQTPIQVSPSQFLPADEPPATIVSLGDSSTTDSAAAPVLPTSDIGLQAPRITELLPNPFGTGNDATDEFIELYNANSVEFDLTGFSLQTGLTTTHSYVFPAGTHLPPKAFVAFYSDVTSLSLSNTSSQVKLLDPFDNAIASTDPYASAKDGVAWALAKGKWYWTTSSTPGAANIITQPASVKKASSTKAAKTSAVKGAKTVKPVIATTGAAGSGETTITPIRIWTLALVVGLALLYAAYEYRTDLANKFHGVRRYLTAWRGSRR